MAIYYAFQAIFSPWLSTSQIATSPFLTSNADSGAKRGLDGHAGDVHDIAHIGAAPGHFGSGRTPSLCRQEHVLESVGF